MKTPTTPTLLGPDGMTSLREYAGYHGGGSGFGGQLRAWNPPSESVDAALLPNFTRGNARADDLVRNNGYAANAIQLHQDHIVGSFFRLSHRPSWRYLGIGEEEARAFSREVEAAWKEFAEDDCCCIDVERKRTFTMMIREGVAMHAFNGELFVQATWDTSSSRLFRTQFRMVSPKRISNPNNTSDSRNCRAGVQINDSGAALGYYVSEDGYPGWMPQKWTWISLVDGSGNPVSVEVQSVTDGLKVKVNRVPDGVAEYSVWGLKLPTLRQRLFRCVSIRENDDGTYAITAVQHVPEKEAIVDNGAHFDGDQSGTVNGVTPPAVQHLTAEVTADSGEYQVLARWDTPKVVKGVSFMLRLTVAADDGSERLVSTARTTETTYRFTQLALGNYRLTVRAANAWGQQGDPASVSFRIAAPAAPSRIELTPGYFQITATPYLAVYDPTVQFEFWFSEKRITDIRQVETTARYLGTALYWIAASINIKPGHDYYFYIRSVNTVGKSAFVEAVGQPSDDASGYLDFFKGEIGKTHLAQELWTQIDNGQLAPDLAEIRMSITDVNNEITQTVNKKLEDQSAAIQQIQKVQVDTNNNLNSMWAVKLQQMQDGRLYIAGIGAGIENTPDGMQSQVLLAADRIAMINPANGNTKPMFVGQGDQIFMNEVFLKYLTAPTITSGGNPPVFSLTPDGRLTAKNADISGNVNANSGTLNNVTINENCRVLGKLSANQIEGDLVETVGKAFPRDSRAPERWPSGTITVRVYDDQPFDRQIVIPAVAFSGARHERENSDTYSSCRLIVKKNGAEIYNRTALDNTLIYTGVIDMPAGSGVMTLEFSVSAWWVNGWYPTASISDLLVVVMKKATAGITIS
ncbi:phage tail tip protein [Escherichia coli]|uniref:phage tail tip domain-containing protein n=3 Tax=Escherichia coli TaxID=562 RepID=UPI0009283F7F|nr:phage portal protein [Escherichia coli]MCK2298750.1 phage portal protein [Escherichia coli]MCK2347518.1 phage portal protein [Escherichia coli]MCS1024635.1 phage portal protein [Escherichia coli]MCW3833712.1 phage portal protein [Escherichia coli]MDM8894003.1 phage portal protein [Escherichia coli]